MASADDPIPTWIGDMPTEKLIELCDQYRRGIVHVGIEQDGRIVDLTANCADAFVTYIEDVIRRARTH